MRAEWRGPVAGVLLAAGTSSRMGRDKLTVEIGDESLLRRAAKRALDAGLAPLVVVLGAGRDDHTRELDGLDVVVVENEEPERGKSRSVKLGIEAVPDNAAAGVVMLADMPLVTSEMIATLVERYREGRAPIVASRYGDVHAPPILYDRAKFGELLAMQGRGCGKAVVKANADRVEAVDWPEEALTDVDRPEDLARARALATGE